MIGLIDASGSTDGLQAADSPIPNVCLAGRRLRRRVLPRRSSPAGCRDRDFKRHSAPHTDGGAGDTGAGYEEDLSSGCTQDPDGDTGGRTSKRRDPRDGLGCAGEPHCGARKKIGISHLISRRRSAPAGLIDQLRYIPVGVREPPADQTRRRREGLDLQRLGCASARPVGCDRLHRRRGQHGPGNDCGHYPRPSLGHRHRKRRPKCPATRRRPARRADQRPRRDSCHRGRRGLDRGHGRLTTNARVPRRVARRQSPAAGVDDQLRRWCHSTRPER